MRWLVLLLVACREPPRHATAPPVAPTRSFNDRVLGLIASYPPGGHGGYVWPSAEGTSGTTVDLRLGDRVIAHGGVGNHCVGVTLEVFWRALEGCPGGLGGAFPEEDSATSFKETWYVNEVGGPGAAAALPAYGLGARVAVEDARAGDFVQAWATSGQGHSMVFLGWDRDEAGSIIGVRYWSSQPWTDGIGVSEMAIGEGGFDPAQIYVARGSCPAIVSR